MEGRYQAYPEYKDSGVEWLGDIPIDWSRLKFKLIASQGKAFASGPFGSSIGSRFYMDEGVPVIRGNNLSIDGKKPFFIDNGYVFLTEDKADELSNAQVNSGDLVFTARGTVGQVGLVPNEENVNWKRAILSANQLRYRNCSNNISSLYLWYLFSSWFVRTQISLSSDSVAQPNLNLGSLKDLQLLRPSFHEQEKIVNFLNHETSKIEALIKKQHLLVKLLKEKHQAVISHAVTKGLNADVPMKYSGVEWLGRIPEHWEIKRFKNLFKIEKRIAGELGYDVLSITQKGVKIKDIESGEGQLSMDYTKYQIVNKGDFAMNHMDLLTGFVDISKYQGVTSPDYRVFTLEDDKSFPDYYLYFLQMGYINKLFFPFGQGAAHIGRWRLPTEAFNYFLAPYPPGKEQKEIAEFIKVGLEKITGLESKAGNAIKLMQERRTALISAAVTGKIDVRSWQPPQKN